MAECSKFPAIWNQNLTRMDPELNWCYTQLVISNRTQKKSIWNKEIQTSENQDKDEDAVPLFCVMPLSIYFCLCVLICVCLYVYVCISSAPLFYLISWSPPCCYPLNLLSLLNVCPSVCISKISPLKTDGSSSFYAPKIKPFTACLDPLTPLPCALLLSDST